MTLDEIDQLLADWNKKIDHVSQNLIDLHGLPTYQRLAGVETRHVASLQGVTQARVSNALEAMNDLFGYFDLLVNTINQANQLRSSIPRFLGSQQKLQEIERILTTPSIQYAVVQTPLAQRSLLSAAQLSNAIAPQDLLLLMTNAFDVASFVVLAVDEAWTRLQPMLNMAFAEIEHLQKLANSLGVNSLQELCHATQKINSLRNRIETDPLGVTQDFTTEIQPQIARVKTTLEQLAKQQTQTKENFARAYQLKSQLIELHRQASAAFQDSTLKVVDHSTLQTPLAKEQIDALWAWLFRLETKFNEGLINPVSIGLENWTTKVNEYIVATQKTYSANIAPLEIRAELRGRLDALKAKALARGLAEDSTLAELTSLAQNLLYTQPTPLNKAAELVSQYEKHLNNQLCR